MNRLFLCAASLALGGCSLLAPLDDHSAIADGGGVLVDGTVSSEAGADAGADATPVGCPDNIVYVSAYRGAGDAGATDAGDAGVLAAEGNDSNHGCDRTHPKRTIAAAIRQVREQNASGHAIHVCAGSYDEDALTLDYPVSLLGGYACDTWERPPGFGVLNFKPNTLADPNLVQSATRLNNTNATARTTLTIRGTIDDRTVVEGFVINWSRSGTGGAHGIDVSGDAGPTIRANTVVGGVVANPTPGPVYGVFIDVLPTRRVRLQGNAIATNVVSGTLSATDPLLATAVFVATGSLDLVGNALDTRIITGSGDETVSVLRFRGGSLRAEQNRFLIGESLVNLGTTVAVDIAFPAKDVVLVNNTIFPGTNASAQDTKKNSDRIGVRLVNMFGPVLRHNTIFSGEPEDTHRATPLALVDTLDATIENNLLAGLGSAGDDASRSYVGVTVTDCAQAVPKSFRGNFFFGFDTALVQCGNAPNTKLDTLEVALGASRASNNRRFAATCTPTVQSNPDFCACNGSETGCTQAPTCAGGSACAGAVFKEWDPTYLGLFTILKNGLSLGTTVPCNAASLAFDAGVTHDLFDQTRAAPFSAGAIEHDGACTP